MIEFNDFNIKKERLIYFIILNGMASVYVDNEYLEFSNRGTKYKMDIIQELLSFFKFITWFPKERFFMLYEISIKKYKRKGFTWDKTSLIKYVKAIKSIVEAIERKVFNLMIKDIFNIRKCNRRTSW